MILQSDKYTNLTAFVWQDTIPVNVVTTNFQSVPLHFVQRKQIMEIKNNTPVLSQYVLTINTWEELTSTINSDSTIMLN